MKWEKVCKALSLGHIWSMVLEWLVLTGLIEAYNIEESDSLLFRGPNGSLFGYSVVLHSYNDDTWIIAGAPKTDWSLKVRVNSPGAIFKCKIGNNPNGTCDLMEMGIDTGAVCGKTCMAEPDNQWLGVSLSRQAKDGEILACGHRWKNIYYMTSEHKLPYGVCYAIPSNLRAGLSKRVCPCYKDYVRKFAEEFGSCQAGISSAYLEDIMVMGAPGSHYWTGSLFVYNTTRNKIISYEDRTNTVKFGSYLGYSVAVGHFQAPDSFEVVGGAPQQEQIGKAYIFSLGKYQLDIIFEVAGTKIGSYFGASVCAVDLNGDGLSDLLVGAPMQSKLREEGSVFVYVNTGGGVMEELPFELSGSDLYAARFGETITNLGDLDHDGFEDVAIGAPHENDLEGAVYIYNGRKNGIIQSFSQRILGKTFGNGLQMFGQSISAGIDVDGNGYQDVAIGAFLSDSVVLLRTKPVVIVNATLVMASSVNRTKVNCIENGHPAVCINVTVCFSYEGLEVPGHIVLHYNISSDTRRKTGTHARFYFLSNGTMDVISGAINILQRIANCKTYQAFMRKDVRDILTPIHMETRYHLGEHIVYKKSKRNVQTFTPLQPILQQQEKSDRVIRHVVTFARYCGLPNCSADLQISGKFSFPKAFENKTYLVVGGSKTLMINVSLYNAGDDAYQSSLQMRLPKGVNFIKVLDLPEKQINCDVNEEENQLITLSCSVGLYYVDSHSKQDISFLLDTSSLSKAEDDLLINITANCENEVNQDMLSNNVVTLVIPTRNEVNLNVIGMVSPLSLVFGPSEEKIVAPCVMEKISFTFNVINSGSSLAPGAKLDIMMPNTFAPSKIRLFNLLDVSTTAGKCLFTNYSRECDTPKKNGTIFGDLVAFFSKPEKRVLFCFEDDSSCIHISCSFGDLESENEVIVAVQLELNLLLLEMDESSVLVFMTTAMAGHEANAKVINMNPNKQTHVFLEALHNQKPQAHIVVLIISLSLLFGLILFLVLTYVLWKVGFFKRKYKSLNSDISWNYVKKDEK
ncbi:integrin alpha-4 [Pelobates cultripes]|uniref:Integrin alpha-4 n=1 Tax=Pelobates cultripes TaxID=61616 RepID=A0AAD1WCS6_PELCU|nr:integrin alpha-4 [Pelobates cultripes]